MGLYSVLHFSIMVCSLGNDGEEMNGKKKFFFFLFILLANAIM